MSFTVSTPGARLAHTDLGVERSRSRTWRGELEFEAEVAPGLTVTWDPATPRECVAASVGPVAATDHARLRAVPARSPGTADRTPWLRLAAVTMLDRRLHLRLDRSLLDAEIAAAEVDAARTLSPGEPIRDHLVDRALVRARRAALGVVQYLDRLATADRCPPPPLHAALHVLADRYAKLSAEVDNYDGALVAVTNAADRLAAVTSVPARVRRGGPAAEPPLTGVAQIDPRLVSARVLRLGPAVDSAEIDVMPVRLADRRALRVAVPAFEPLPDPVDLPDVGVRLVHRRSGHVHGYGLLGLVARPGYRCFEGLVSLPDAVTDDDVRVELHDVSGSPSPVFTDAAQLRRVRRAALFLAGWRALVADARIWGSNAGPTARLQTVVRALSPEADRDPDAPLWAGGPALSHLRRIAGLGDRTLAALLRAGASPPIAGDDGGAAAVVDSVGGPGGLLAAELAAAYERAVPA